MQIQMPMKVKLIQRVKGLNISDKIQEHLGLSLELCGNYSSYCPYPYFGTHGIIYSVVDKPGVTLEYLINEFFMPKMIDNQPSETKQRFLYKDAPNILFLHILANIWDTFVEEAVKSNYYIIYKRKMTLWLDIVTEANTAK